MLRSCFVAVFVAGGAITSGAGEARAATAAAPVVPGKESAGPVAEPDSLGEEIKRYNSMSLEDLLSIVVSTASQTDDTVLSAPAVVTVITREQIEDMGARTLMDVLWNVPGFTRLQDNNEALVAVHGVYTTTNRNFLVLRDGHRLNEALFENAEPDYSITLDNVRRIEIVRGPGASLYGNAAFTAVINLVTVDASDAEGATAKVRGGYPNQLGASLVFARNWTDGGVMLFASAMNMDGEKAHLTLEEDYGQPTPDARRAGTMRVDNYPTNYDVGMKATHKGFSFSASTRHSDYMQAKGNLGQTVDGAALFRPLEQRFDYNYLDLAYNNTIAGSVALSLRHYVDMVSYESWQLTQAPNATRPRGREFSLNYSAYRYGANYSAQYNYDLGRYTKGNLLVGGAAERWVLKDSFFLDNLADSNTMVRSGVPLLPKGSEYNAAGYVQLKNQVLPQLILNLGARYDYYEAFKGSLNPRAAIIAPLFDFLTVKLIYARAFQAPSYFYRESNPNLGYGAAEDLRPERMESLQAAVQASFPNFLIEVVGFRNNLTNLITRDTTTTPNVYRNSGEMLVNGLAAEVRYIASKGSAFANYALQAPDVKQTVVTQLANGTVRNIPKHSGNAGLTLKVVQHVSLTVWANYTGRVLWKPAEPLPSRVLVNASLVLRDLPAGLFASVSAYNLLDKKYDLAGTVPPQRQASLWVQGTLGYSF